ncbi:MAG: sugar phosphate isomerase/epimerase family protein [Ardenticatenaceae bacterium]
MSLATFTLSAFGDEIADDLHEQLDLLSELGVHHLEFRAAWGKNVLDMDDGEVALVKQICDEYGIAVSAIGSPIGKSPLLTPIEYELGNLRRISEIAKALGTNRIRVFSFYPPDRSSNAHYDMHLEEVIDRLTQLTELAAQEGMILLLENEKEIVGDTPERCYAIVSAIESPHLRFAWDPANFIQIKVAQPFTRGWSLLSPYVSYVHIKDSRLADGSICAAGEGDGQLRELLTALRQMDYQGILALEPHLALAGHSSGFSGVSGMTYAVNALRNVMAEVGCQEQPHES